MRYGRTSVVVFVSRLVMSFAGFVSTIVLTRTLGRDGYGTYVVVLSVMTWIVVASTLGLPEAIRKRVSESGEGNYVVSGAILQLGLLVVVAVSLWTVRSWVNAFVGMEATWIIIIILVTRIATTFVETILHGQHLVHLASFLSPIEWISRSVVQIALVLSGFGIVGAFAGYAAGAVVAIIIGLYLIDVPRVRPSRRDFTRIRSYAQLSWLGTVKSRTFLSMDTIVLAIFVSNSLIAVYEVSWNLASLFALFSKSIRDTLFPEISRISSADDPEEMISDLTHLSLTYAGLFVIPGMVGAAVVGDTVLTIYGPGFDIGHYILVLLALARLLDSYMEQLLSVINAVDRPGLTLYVNGVFIVTNLVLNVFLTWRYGWFGAATATTASAGIGLALAYRYADRVVSVVVPVGEIAKQWFSAGVMCLVVLGGRVAVGDSLPIIIVLVAVGAGVYFITLMALSRQFRATVRDNLPFAAPFL